MLNKAALEDLESKALEHDRNEDDDDDFALNARDR